MLAGILDVAACLKEREVQHRRRTRDLCSRVAKCILLDSGIFEHLLLTVTKLSGLFLRNKSLI